ncbi:MAG: SDR family NAD(P)-dependent oxidoreductase [Acidimicrobiales bacterium]|nr:SDR family NAD(P)-dependent oxidoreductase [Acidimicrobiales bacterium]|tara:strand:+ start:3039 stop:3926 length:888 start_codon:yes stop_codon:yes gene_type:complete
MAENILIEGSVAVVTGGASGIGKGITKALLNNGATVVVADIEEKPINDTLNEFSDLGSVDGFVTDVASEESVENLSTYVYKTYGKCNLLFNNAGVGSGGGGKAWQNEPNDWKWCFSVNVFGPAHGVISFVPKMIASGEPGHIINTSSGDGGFAPVPMASVYASSKAAVSCFTEALNHQLLDETKNMGASVFYPSGGLMNTGLFTSQRNRPKELERIRGGTGRKSMSFEELKDLLEKAGRDVKVADLDEMGEFVVQAVRERRYIIGRDLEDTVELLHRRAEAISAFLCPPHHDMGI